MAVNTEVLGQKKFGKGKIQSADKTMLDNDRKSEMKKSEAKMVDITKEQWFWDQAVLS